MPSWKRLIRFKDENGTEYFGEPQVDTGDDVVPQYEAGKLKATVLEGASVLSEDLTAKGDKVVVVKELLSPLTKKDVPVIRCVGLNFMKHIQEGGRSPPPYPSLFLKGNNSLAEWNEDVPIPKICQEWGCDYEGELCFVLSKDAKDIKKEDAKDYILGYCVGNDVSNRRWQRDPAYAGGTPQWCYSKGFDKYAPLGPVLVSPSVAGTARDLQLQTRVNGDLRQNETTNDMLFDVPYILEFFSQGTTIEKGTVIMTGTPSGVGFGFKPEPKFFGHQDRVEVSITGLGSVSNKMVFT